MAPATKFNPPSANLPGKPFVPEWVPPPVTQQKEDFAELTSIDLSLMDSDDPAVVDDLVGQVKRAIREDGFLFLENYGVSLQQLHRQFALAQYLYENIGEEDKERLLFNPETGVWSGYKHPYGFKVSIVSSINQCWKTNNKASVTVEPLMASSNSTGTNPTGKT
jgi:isopenicillin N synthase-like dioxygenase